MTLSLGFSPCPNDTYLFYALVHGRVAQGFNVSTTLADIETLNKDAKNKHYAVTKLSMAAYPTVWDAYQMLPVGTAVSMGYGPKIVGYPEGKEELKGSLSGKKIAVPGQQTTAFLALRILYGSDFKPIFCPYHEVMQKVKRREVDYGLLIHETRTHFAHEGVEEKVDLGAAWQERYNLPLPLGGLFIQRDLPLETKYKVVQGLRNSLKFARSFPKQVEPYLLQHAQEKDLAIIGRHLDLYVTSETEQLSALAKLSLLHFFDCGKERNWWGKTPQEWLLDA